MKIVHRITKNLDVKTRDQLRRIGIEVELGLVTFEIDESHPSWPELKALLAEWVSVDMVSTKFTEAERREAAYLTMEPAWHYGYPQPANDFGYLAASYDLTDYCAECGMGYRQVAPFRMKGEPKWGTRHILQMNWLFDEYFVRPGVWTSVFAPFGVGCKPVVHHRTGQELETVVQLDVATTAAFPLRLTGKYASAACPRCGRTKYLPVTRGRFPSFTGTPTDHMQKTQEAFGDGASAWNAIVVSSDLFRAIRDHKLKGAGFAPCAAPL